MTKKICDKCKKEICQLPGCLHQNNETFCHGECVGMSEIDVNLEIEDVIELARREVSNLKPGETTFRKFWTKWMVELAERLGHIDYVHVDPSMLNKFEYKIDLQPWWENYKKRKTIDHASGTITEIGSKPYDEMWDFINEEVIPEVKRETQESVINALRVMIKSYEVEK